MLARRCDRCNSYFMPDMTYHDTKNTFKRIIIKTCKKNGTPVNDFYNENKDLCNDCYDKLVKFMNMEDL